MSLLLSSLTAAINNPNTTYRSPPLRGLLRFSEVST